VRTSASAFFASIPDRGLNSLAALGAWAVLYWSLTSSLTADPCDPGPMFAPHLVIAYLGLLAALLVGISFNAAWAAKRLFSRRRATSPLDRLIPILLAALWILVPAFLFILPRFASVPTCE
jgi:hypothetical protein